MNDILKLLVVSFCKICSGFANLPTSWVRCQRALTGQYCLPVPLQAIMQLQVWYKLVATCCCRGTLTKHGKKRKTRNGFGVVTTNHSPVTLWNRDRRGSIIIFYHNRLCFYKVFKPQRQFFESGIIAWSSSFHNARRQIFQPRISIYASLYAYSTKIFNME